MQVCQFELSCRAVCSSSFASQITGDKGPGLGLAAPWGVGLSFDIFHTHGICTYGKQILDGSTVFFENIHLDINVQSAGLSISFIRFS